MKSILSLLHVEINANQFVSLQTQQSPNDILNIIINLILYK